ncbi:hypothetical protein JQ634_34485 [Bradyrhizobium sp. AUGA SZCCT0240]|uniref:hypothetical protein n=1 Tax=unclassified Bradyrhizobium TaxID=2631580 RepID=UPI001BA84528|nr:MULTISPECIES: hypothetical protein [unclassified Bradyrhizobium]MBR1200955.1 hypothetical protein [Bradyrhizobium sp. AUGA SZCCT0158]MBR1258761.1 hypothetical protein [Bradyrhizobium sp. AUGA SZCCT0240]
MPQEAPLLERITIEKAAPIIAKNDFRIKTLMLEGTHQRVPNGLTVIKRFSDTETAVVERPLERGFCFT